MTMSMVVQKLMAITFCLLYFSDIVTGKQYLMGWSSQHSGSLVPISSLPVEEKVVLSPSPPGSWRDLGGGRDAMGEGGCKRAVNGVWTKKRG